MYFQKEIKLQSYNRGIHLITSCIEEKIQDSLSKFNIGIAHIFIKHTSASLTINENADSTVRDDLESFFNDLVPENKPYYKHTFEGSDDMPAHIKSSIFGSSISIPILNGNFNFGTWQGIYLCEHRNSGGPRNIIITIIGESKT